MNNNETWNKIAKDITQIKYGEVLKYVIGDYKMTISEILVTGSLYVYLYNLDKIIYNGIVDIENTDDIRNWFYSEILKHKLMG